MTLSCRDGGCTSPSAGARCAPGAPSMRCSPPTPPAPTPEEAEQGAAAAEWELPERLAAMAFEAERPGRVAAHLPEGSLVARVAGVDWALIPHAAAERRQVEPALRGGRGALGPTVSWPRTWRSAERARLALEVAPLIGDKRLLIADEHLLELLLHRDRGLT